MRLKRSYSCASIIAAVLLAGCASGPDFSAPSAPDVSAYDYEPLAETTADNAQKFLKGEEIPAAWWELFRSPGLNKLVEQAIKDNPNLAAAEASLRVARDNLSAGTTMFFPTVGGSLSSARNQVTAAASGLAPATSVYSLHSASVGVSYNPDVWGGTRRSVERLQAEADSALFQKEAAYLSLTSNVVTLAVAEASLREQVEAMSGIVASQEKILEIFKLKFKSGAVPKSALVAQQASLATAKASLPPLKHQLSVTRHALSALIGQMPEKQPSAVFRLSEMKLPETLPLSVPSKLVEQRPDVRAAQENLHAASAAIGMAVSARLPNI
ncbi:MAG: efflux transporter outer membrane subunit, partial [Alphaproteobacteria bacterium]|nr:efflux transporter outer membrane subunit [Alphaproteobacteria bacterium]